MALLTVPSYDLTLWKYSFSWLRRLRLLCWISEAREACMEVRTRWGKDYFFWRLSLQLRYLRFVSSALTLQWLTRIRELVPKSPPLLTWLYLHHTFSFPSRAGRTGEPYWVPPSFSLLSDRPYGFRTPFSSCSWPGSAGRMPSLCTHRCRLLAPPGWLGRSEWWWGWRLRGQMDTVVIFGVFFAYNLKSVFLPLGFMFDSDQSISPVPQNSQMFFHSYYYSSIE